MNQRLIVNNEYWLNKNPDIEFRKVKKAFYGTHLLSAKLYICGASMRYYDHDMPRHLRVKTPNYTDFMAFIKRHVMKFNSQKLLKIDDDRYVHVNRTFRGDHREPDGSVHRVYDAEMLYAFYKLIKTKPNGIRISREYDKAHIYANDIGVLIDTINRLQVPDSDIKRITSPGENDIELLLSGKEFNPRANEYKFKIFLKPAGKNGIPGLANYLKSIDHSTEVEVPQHCYNAISGPVEIWSWAYSQRSYFYAKDEDTILLIKMLAGDRYSNAVELILPSKD